MTLRLRLIIIVGITLIAIASSYIFNGAPSLFATTYQTCIAWTPIPSKTPGPDGFNGVRHPIMTECSQYSVRLMPWVATWLIESGAALALVAAVTVTAFYGRRTRV
jgi:hypothetical protein